MFTTDELTDTDLFGRDLPRHRTVKALTRQCLICGLRGPRAIDADHRLCDHCLENLPESKAVCEGNVRRVTQELNQAHEGWVQYQAALSDDTALRWTGLVQARQLAKTKLDRAKTGARRKGDEQRYQANLDAVTAAWQRVQAKIDRTKKDAGNPLADVLSEESRYLATVRRLEADLQRWEMALSDIEAAIEPPLF